jgi:hypothetical protein
MSDDSEPFIEIGSEDYPSESESLGLTSTPTPTPPPTPGLVNQRQGKTVRRKSIIIYEAPERGVQSTKVALPPTSNTALELKGHQDSNSDDIILSQNPEIQEKVLLDLASNASRQVVPRLMLSICPKARLIYLKQILTPSNESLPTTSSDTLVRAPELLSQDLNRPFGDL